MSEPTDAKDAARGVLCASDDLAATVDASAQMLNLPLTVWSFLTERHSLFAKALLTAQSDVEYPFVNVDRLPEETKAFLRRLVRSHSPLRNLLADPNFIELRQGTHEIFKAQLSLQLCDLLNALREFYDKRQRARITQSGHAQEHSTTIAAVA